MLGQMIFPKFYKSFKSANSCELVKTINLVVVSFRVWIGLLTIFILPITKFTNFIVGELTEVLTRWSCPFASEECTPVAQNKDCKDSLNFGLKEFSV